MGCMARDSWEWMWWQIVPGGPRPADREGGYSSLSNSSAILVTAGTVLIFIPGGQPLGAALLVTGSTITFIEGTSHLADFMREGNVEHLVEGGICIGSVMTQTRLVKELRRIPALQSLSEEELSALASLVIAHREKLMGMTLPSNPGCGLSGYRSYCD